MSRPRVGREAGPKCLASCPTEGREACRCDLPPVHDGTTCWCFGAGDHAPHGWATPGGQG